MNSLKRFLHPPERSYFLFGPRGTGKTTFLRKYYQEAIWIDLLKSDTERFYLNAPERLLNIIKANPNQSMVVVDEIQRVPNLLPVIHDAIYQNQSLLFVLTGSSARKIKRHSRTDLLGGRASQRLLHPFMATELGEQFDLEQALEFGMLPLLYNETDKQDVLNAYLTLYINEEVKTEGLVRHIDGFSRFVEAISFSHGSLLNISNVSRECAVKRKTVESYIDILEDLLLSFRLNIFTRRAKRILSAHPKFYIFDCGVFRTIRPKGPLDSYTDLNGPALEGLVAQHLRGWCDYSKAPYQLAFWRTKSGLEVDFVIYGEDCFVAIEVKNASTIAPADLKGLKAFAEDYPESTQVLLYRGNERIVQYGILCLPVVEFLKGLYPDRSLIDTSV